MMHPVFAVASVVGNALVEVGGFAPFPPVYEPQVLRLPFGSFRMTGFLGGLGSWIPTHPAMRLRDGWGTLAAF